MTREFLAALLATRPGDQVPTLTVRPAWQNHANCRGVGPRIFFDAAHRDTAAALCSTCPVAHHCDNAARTGREHGVWAGLDEKERRHTSATPRPDGKASQHGDRPLIAEPRRLAS